MKKKLKLIGKFTIYNVTKKKIEVQKNNIIVDDGLALLSDRLSSNGVNFLTNVALGDNPALESASDSALAGEQFRKAFTTTSTPLGVFRAETTITGSEALFTWREMGVFNAGAAGVMMNRVTIDFTHNSGDTLNVIWEFTFARG